MIASPRTEIEEKEARFDSFDLFSDSILISSILVVYQATMK